MPQATTTPTSGTQRRPPRVVPLAATQRERLHAQVSYAGEAIAPNWPIRTFISRNPLSGFESMTFDMAIRRAHELFGGRGLLPLDEYRELHRQGRIRETDVQAAIEKYWPGARHALDLGSHTLTPLHVALFHVLYGINELHPNLYQWTVSQGGVLERIRSEVSEEVKTLLREKSRQRIRDARPWKGETTLAEWMARMTGLDVPRWIVEAMTHDRPPHAAARTSRPAGNDARDTRDETRNEGTSILPLASLVRDPDEYRTPLRALFDRLKDHASVSSLSFPLFASRWLAHEADLLPALAEYFCGSRTGVEKFEQWTRILARPEAWYLKGLWLSVLNATGAADPALPDALRAWMSRMRKPMQCDTRTELGSVSLSFVRPLAEWVGELSGEDLVGHLDEVMIRWCSAFLDEGLAHWTMPKRSRGFYRAWKELARHDYSLVLHGMGEMRREIDQWPDHPEDAIVTSLQRMEIPEDHWEEYFRRHLVRLPGWVGYIRWRMQNPEQPQQQHAPINLVEYLAVRLFYEMVVTERTCRRRWAIPGTLGTVEELCRGRGPSFQRRQSHEELERVCDDAWRLFQLAQFLGWMATDVQALSPDDLATLRSWLDRFPEDRQGLIWQDAYEAGYRRQLIDSLLPAESPSSADSQGSWSVSSSTAGETPAVRPDAQAVFCIDVRSEPLRRHLETQGHVETVGFAGFFGVPICYQGLGSQTQAALCPVLIKPKNLVRETPRVGQDHRARRFSQGLQWTRFGQHLFHELKSHPITSFPLIDVVGWLFGVALLGKTLFPVAFHRLLTRFKDWGCPRVATRIPVDKLSKAEAERLLDEGERALVRSFLHRSARWQALVPRLTPERLDLIRHHALAVHPRGGQTFEGPSPGADVLEALDLQAEQWLELIRELRDRCGLTMENRAAQLDRLSAEGFTLTEQVFMVERALQLTGLTHTFARVVLWCGHGSTTENNPYAAAYDCGACGGNHGGPNARVLAAMANNFEVRQQLRDRGIVIPEDTWFLAGEHDTTTDRVALFDLEDVPVSHRPDVARLEQALDRASSALAQERCRRLPGAPRRLDAPAALRHTYRRSVDWAQIRPEWGLSGNAAFIIGSRALTRHLDLQGRTFLHNYDAARDTTGKVLETIMTAPLVVAEWINLQYFFSAVDPWIYGSGSKVLHNVVGGIGVMLGAHADFQQGLPLQTVRDGARLYHEPLRLLVVIEASPQTVSRIIGQHTILQHFFHHGWVHLLALDPDTRHGYEYSSSGHWRALPGHRRNDRGASER